MGRPRKALISLDATPYYHVVARCVRRAWLWGYDSYAARDYSHRKTWVLQRLDHLGEVFAVDLCAYAVMSNHYHLVLRVDRERSKSWTQEQVIERWAKIFGTPPELRNRLNDPCDEVRSVAENLVENWRSRLVDVSWYMRCLNEYLARRANAEDDCTGRFWEGRFKSQALLDEAGLLAAMAYVDLNPIRAGIAESVEDSEFTSIYARIRAARAASSTSRTRPRAIEHIPALLPFSDSRNHSSPRHRIALPPRLDEYVELLNWSARTRRDTGGDVISSPPPILDRLRMNPRRWRQLTLQPGLAGLARAIGDIDAMRSYARHLGQSWVKGLRTA